MHYPQNPKHPSSLEMAHSPVLRPISSEVPPDSSLAPELQRISHLLHLTHHRNKNQHRLAKWYKPFSQLRRQLVKLIIEVEALETALKFSTSSVSAEIEGRAKERGKEKGKYVKAARDAVGIRVRFLRELVVPKCFTSFSNVVADGRYAALGLFLVATLASLQNVMRHLVGSEVGSSEGLIEKDKSLRDFEMNLTEADLGETVMREDVTSEQVTNEDNVFAPEPGKGKKKRQEPVKDFEDEYKVETPPKKKAKKKRKKVGDEFDEMFAGLI
ncbi:hypothetical protein PZA11_002728 [Diplocarpon coronariae]|nr:hypothetical protein JHW43_003233 [Diplocarpon mali]